MKLIRTMTLVALAASSIALLNAYPSYAANLKTSPDRQLPISGDDDDDDGGNPPSPPIIPKPPVVETGNPNLFANPIVGQVGPFQITLGFNTQKCLDLAGPSQNDGAIAQIYDCLGAGQANQLYSLVPTSGAYGQGFEIVSQFSGKCLDINGGGSANGTRTQQWDCEGATQTSQIWQFVPYTTGYQIQSVATGRCLDLNGGNTGNGNYTQIWDCGSGTNVNQLWQFNSVSAASANRVPFEITFSSNTQKCVDISGVSKTPGTNAQIWVMPFT